MRNKPMAGLIILWAALFMTILPGLTALALDPQPEPPPITLLIDGRPLITDVSPIILDGRTMVPLRAISGTLGAEVFWSDADHVIKAVKDGQTLQLRISSSTAIIDGNPVAIDVPPQIRQGRALVPVRFISRVLGADVQWDPVMRRVTITSAAAADFGMADSHAQPLSIAPSADTSAGNDLLRQGDAYKVDSLSKRID